MRYGIRAIDGGLIISDYIEIFPTIEDAEIFCEQEGIPFTAIEEVQE